MVHFGKQLLLLQYKPWKAFYLDYNRLKFVLEGQGDAAAFEILLQQEVERVALFLLQQQGLVATELARLCLLDESASSSSSSSLLSDYRAVGESIVQLLRFVQLNVTALRKILKKHDRLFTKRKLTWKLLQQQQQRQQRQNPSSLSHHCHYHVRVLLAAAHQNNPHLQALIQSLQQGLQAIHNQQHTQLQRQHPYDNQVGFFTPRRRHTEPNLLLPLQQQQQQPQRTSTSSNLMDFLQQSTSSSSSSSLLLLRQEPILWRIQVAQGRLDESSSRLVQLLAAPLLEENTTSTIEEEEEEEEETLQSQQEQELATITATVLPSSSSSSYSRSISNILNLLSTFLYLTNYYIAAPTSGAYAARLHNSNNNNNNSNNTNGSGSQVLAGLVMGMTPTAALAGTLLYSYWTSYSYKAALVFAAGAAIVGNVLYAGALPSHNLSWILAGRLLIGLGSCRSINRRYIADAYTRTTRTAAAATFVTAGSAGMAVGPALAALLQYVTPNSSSSSSSTSTTTTTMNDNDKHTNDWWSVENAPGWVMAVAWTVYLVVLLLYFQDPPRHSNNDSKNNVSMIASKATVVGNSGSRSSSSSQHCTTHEGERQALLSNKAGSVEIAHKKNKASESFVSNHSDNDDDDDNASNTTTTTTKASSWHYTTIPVVATLVICFLLKMTLECLLSSTATVTAYYFDWDTSTVGIYLALQGLCMFPANLIVAAASQGGYEDRDIILWTLIFMTIGTWGIMEYNNNGQGNNHYDNVNPNVDDDDDDSLYTIFQYIFFGMIIFIATNALEGPNMSLLSKTIPKRWSRGFFNMGLLATEAGTLGRTVGDFCLTWFGLGAGGIESMLNHTFFVLSITLSITVVVTYKIFPFLEPRD